MVTGVLEFEIGKDHYEIEISGCKGNDAIVRRNGNIVDWCKEINIKIPSDDIITVDFSFIAGTDA